MSSPQSLTITIAGMSCQHCVQTVQKALLAAPGVLSATVDLPTNSAHLAFDPQTNSVASLMQTISRAGFTPTAFTRDPA